MTLTGAGNAFCAGGNFEMVQQMVEDFDVRMKNLHEACDVVYNMINCTKFEQFVRAEVAKWKTLAEKTGIVAN